MSRKTEVVFRRPKAGFEEFDPENWDDSAMSKAYDVAVKKLNDTVTASPKNDVPGQVCREKTRTSDKSKENLASANGTHKFMKPNIKVEKSQNSRTKSRKKDTRMSDVINGGTVTNSVEWKIGDDCIAIYYEDGLYYNCRVKSIDNYSNTCVVEYLGYGNEETVNVYDLHSTEQWNKNHKRNESESSQETSITSTESSSGCSASSNEDTSSDITQDIYKRQNTKNKSGRSKCKQHANFFQPPAAPNIHFNPFMMPPPPFLGFGGAINSKSHMGGDGATRLNNEKLQDLSDDALSSMLMSWYMAGYHTGYYQGKNAQNSKMLTDKGPNKQ